LFSLSENTKAVPPADWKELFYQWFVNFDGSEPFMFVNRGENAGQIEEFQNAALTENAPECKPQLEVDFNQMKLSTPCPGRLHYLKFAFHPTWKADSGDHLYLLSPGFIGLIPSKNVVVLRFGQSRLWQAAGWVSCGSLLLLIFLGRKRRGRA
jgi:hypothetical protein